MNLFNIERAYKDMDRRKWEKLYWAIDLHDTIIPGKYSKFNEDREFYPGALEVLTNRSKRSDTCLILYTSSHMDSAWDIFLWLKASGCEFDYINHNPECPSTNLCDFKAKLYFNILLDDKAGFDGQTDWLLIKQELQRINKW